MRDYLVPVLARVRAENIDNAVGVLTASLSYMMDVSNDDSSIEDVSVNQPRDAGADASFQLLGDDGLIRFPVDLSQVDERALQARGLPVVLLRREGQL